MEARAEPAEDGAISPLAETTLTIRVFREDSDTGVAADVERIEDAGARWFANVDDSGIARLAQACSAGQRFQATPKVPAFLKSPPEECASTITFRLYGTEATYQLIRVGDTAARGGDLLVAQANYGLAAERLQWAHPDKAQNLQTLASAAAGRLLGVDNPTVSVQGQETVSPETIEALKDYQRGAALPQTGRLDAATREAMTRTPPHIILRRALESPVAAPSSNQLEFRSSIRAVEVESVEMTPAVEADAIALRQRVERANADRTN
jgi:hypothetical protein